jgi:hypothetical protein
MPPKIIQFGDEGQVATRELLRRFDEHPGRSPALRNQIGTLEALERRHGGSGPIDLEDVESLVAAILRDLEALGDPDLTLGVALWAIRHEVPLDFPEPVVNALAERSNLAANKQELAAVFGLMQGVIAHVASRLSADLERSNPERPWRILHANFAITAIRTEDPELMAFAFDALEHALPDEAPGFYAEALARALAPGIAPAVRQALEARTLAPRQQNLR